MNICVYVCMYVYTCPIIANKDNIYIYIYIYTHMYI